MCLLSKLAFWAWFWGLALGCGSGVCIVVVCVVTVCHRVPPHAMVPLHHIQSMQWSGLEGQLKVIQLAVPGQQHYCWVQHTESWPEGGTLLKPSFKIMAPPVMQLAQMHYWWVHRPKAGLREGTSLRPRLNMLNPAETLPARYCQMYHQASTLLWRKQHLLYHGIDTGQG